MFNFLRLRWMELAFLIIGFPFLAWAVVGNPTRTHLIQLQGQPSAVREVRHAFGTRTLEFRINGSKLLTFGVESRRTEVTRLLRDTQEVKLSVWPTAGPDRDLYEGEVVGITVDKHAVLSYGDWWASHVGDLFLRFILGSAFCALAFWYLARRPPMRADAGEVLPPDDMTVVPARVVLGIAGVMFCGLLSLMAWFLG